MDRAECKMQNAECKTQNAQCRMHNAECTRAECASAIFHFPFFISDLSQRLWTRIAGPACFGVLVLVVASAPSYTQAPEPGPIRFENVSEASRSDTFVAQQHATPEKHMVETMAGGVAVFDYDDDGLPDIYFTNGASHPIARARKSPTGIVGSVTGCPAVHGRHREGRGQGRGLHDRGGSRGLRQRRPRGSLRGRRAAQPAVPECRRRAVRRRHRRGRASTEYTWSVAAGWFDYDNDGWLDLFVSNYVDWTPETNTSAATAGATCGSTAIRGTTGAGQPRCTATMRDGTFTDVSADIPVSRATIGKGMSVAFADYDTTASPTSSSPTTRCPTFCSITAATALRGGRL